MTYKELIQNLRICGKGGNCIGCELDGKCGGISRILADAADRLEALLAENEHLREATKMFDKDTNVPSGGIVMTEYIDREDVREMMHMEFDDNYADEAVDKLQAADVVPVRHGHWIDCEDEYSSYVRCSVCGDEYTNWEADCAHTDFCPGCGADMRGADNG